MLFNNHHLYVIFHCYTYLSFSTKIIFIIQSTVNRCSKTCLISFGIGFVQIIIKCRLAPFCEVLHCFSISENPINNPITHQSRGSYLNMQKESMDFKRCLSAGASSNKSNYHAKSNQTALQSKLQPAVTHTNLIIQRSNATWHGIQIKKIS